MPRDDHDRAELAQPPQRLVGEPDGVDRRQRAVVEVARDAPPLDPLGARGRHDVLDARRLRGEQRLPVEGAAEVPVGGVQDPHRSITMSAGADGTHARLQGFSWVARPADVNPGWVGR